MDTDFIIPGPEHLREMRARAVAAMHEMDWSVERKHITADLVVRAMEEAMRAISRVTDSAPEGTKLEVLAMALQVTTAVSAGLVSGVRKTLNDIMQEFPS